MKLEVGMYVRTKYGYLARITEVNDNSIYCDNAITRDWGEEFYLLYSDQFKEIVKASHDITDLIEIGDYVNGHKVEQIWEDNQRFGGCDYMFNIDADDIKSIVTKEQFESMTYKVGGSNE